MARAREPRTEEAAAAKQGDRSRISRSCRSPTSSRMTPSSREEEAFRLDGARGLVRVGEERAAERARGRALQRQRLVAVVLRNRRVLEVRRRTHRVEEVHFHAARGDDVGARDDGSGGQRAHRVPRRRAVRPAELCPLRLHKVRDEVLHAALLREKLERSGEGSVFLWEKYMSKASRGNCTWDPAGDAGRRSRGV
jgi:hypothetical protein